jgi:Uma2 family endonuclease
MTLDEFLRWEDGTDIRYELIRGVPVPREVQPVAHGMLLARLCSVLHSALKDRRDSVAQMTAAIASPSDPDTCYLADLVATPMPIRWNEQLVHDPILIIEILSESTAAFDRGSKVPDYRRISSVNEILLIDSGRILVELHQRQGVDWTMQIIADPAVAISLSSAGIEISMSELYDGLPLPTTRISEP